jgi:peptidoglycan biosynthesis protein MviN/MurJ (putative lipid II flippase)
MTVLAIGLNYAFIKTNQGIEGVALATSLAFLCYFMIFFYYAFKHLMNHNELRQTMLWALGICFYMAAGLYGVQHLFHVSCVLFDASLKLCIFLIIFSPVLIYFEKKEGVFKSIGSIIAAKWKGMFHAPV